MNDVLDRLDRIESLLVSTLGRKPVNDTVKTPEAARMLGMHQRTFRRAFVDTEILEPIPGHKSIFYRREVEALKTLSSS
jgi:hypothetical protein